MASKSGSGGKGAKGPKKKLSGATNYTASKKSGLKSTNPSVRSSSSSSSSSSGDEEGEGEGFCAGPDQQAFRDVLRSFKKANSPRKLVTFLQGEAAAGILTQCQAVYGLRTLQV
jgi:hypothetical protein